MLDFENKPFNVFCDFNANNSKTWTLIQSYQENKKYLFWRQFSLDYPLNENNPSWSEYRLSKGRMKSIERDSIKWRFTCCYNADGVIYTDYAQGKKVEINILDFNGGGRCVKMEYINVLGRACRNCTAYWIQDTSVPFHFNPESFQATKCDFNPTGPLECHEDYFGVYDCQNTQHRCSSSNVATTQTWFG